MKVKITFAQERPYTLRMVPQKGRQRSSRSSPVLEAVASESCQTPAVPLFDGTYQTSERTPLPAWRLYE